MGDDRGHGIEGLICAPELRVEESTEAIHERKPAGVSSGRLLLH
jgi:hypothetical protein